MEASPTEVRIEHSVADQRALTRGFTVFYAAIAAAGLIATLFQPELLLGTVFFALVVAWWAWRVRRAQQSGKPWLVALTPVELRHSAAGVDVRIRRAEAGEVALDTRAGPRMRLHVLEVRDADGNGLLTISLPGKDESTMLEAAFEEWGWPVRR
jgi:hypothetical protein